MRSGQGGSELMEMQNLARPTAEQTASTQSRVTD